MAEHWTSPKVASAFLFGGFFFCIIVFNMVAKMLTPYFTFYFPCKDLISPFTINSRAGPSPGCCKFE